MAERFPLGSCPCGEPVHLLEGKPIVTVNGHLVCEACEIAIRDEQELGPGRALPHLAIPNGR